MKKRLQVLHLEDEPLDAELLNDVLALENIPVESKRVATRTGFEEALDREQFDLIFCDNSLPAFDGLSALAIARQKAPDTPFIFLSGTLGEEVAIEALKGGATDYVLKQRMQRLVPVVRRALREAEERQKRQTAEAEMRRRADEFESLYETARDLSTARELPELLETVADRARLLLKGDSASVSLYDETRQELVIATVIGAPSPTGVVLPLGKGLAGLVAQTRQHFIVGDYSGWEGAIPEFRDIGINGMIHAPMLHGTELIGTLGVSMIGHPDRWFTEDDAILLNLFAAQAAGAIKNSRLFAQVRRRSEQLEALYNIGLALTETVDLSVTLNRIVDRVAGSLAVDAVNLLQFNPATEMLEFGAARGFETHGIEQVRLRTDQGQAGNALRERRIVQIPDLASTDLVFTRSALLAQERFAAYYCIPMISNGIGKGVLELFHRSTLALDAETIDFLVALAAQAAVAIDNAALVHDLQHTNDELFSAYNTTLEGWSRALDLRDKETEGHTERVTEICLRLAAAMGIEGEPLLQIRRGALLHDIGKMGIPDSILHKPGPLGEIEWLTMKRHPEYAFALLSPIAYLSQALDIPLCHHEKWDGTGYPRGLSGEEIPLAARIFAVVDVWDALRSDRPYRQAWSAGQALEYIKEQSGKHFDPRVVQAFLRMVI